ncbi:MAG: hypothetical protein JSV89_05265 [Spirochaetaceae bacterium]|nr:MAG: hypothetical protein JSV89_05265 [Spirochaetaceae bacterium]
MLEKTKLEEISSELPEHERRELLARITRSMGREAHGEYSRIELKQEERERLLAEEMQNLSFWTRFFLWLKGLLSGKSKRDLFVGLKINQLKRGIRHKSSGLTGFETRDLAPKFARQLFDLYHASFSLRGLFQAFHSDQEFRSRAITYLFDNKLPDAKRTLEDFLSTEEMERIFHDTGSEEEVRKRLLRKFNDYAKRIPDKLVRQLEEGIKPLVYLKNLILFSYANTFRHFNYQPTPGVLADKYPYFTNAPVMLMLEQLERLWHALNLAENLGSEWFCHEELFSFYLEEILRAEGAEGEELEPDQEEVFEQANAVAELVAAAYDFMKKTPLLELLRYFRKDPYYKLVFAVPRFQAKPMYVSGLRERILDQLEIKIIVVKKRVIETKIKEIFRTDQLYEMFYYVEKPSFDYAGLELPYFSYTKSLKILYNYLSKIYKGYIQETLQITNAFILAGNRIIQTRLNQYAAGLEELEAKLVLFDRSIAPDEDDGKTLLRLRHRLDTDLNQQKLYRNFVIQKDKEARELVDQGIEYLVGIKRVYDDLIASPMESIKSALKTLHFFKGKNQTLANLLHVVSELVTEFQDLLSQLVALEKGS